MPKKKYACTFFLFFPPVSSEDEMPDSVQDFVSIKGDLTFNEILQLDYYAFIRLILRTQNGSFLIQNSKRAFNTSSIQTIYFSVKKKPFIHFVYTNMFKLFVWPEM